MWIKYHWEKETVNGDEYLQIIKEKVPLFMSIRNSIYFQHDGAPAHRCAKANRCMFKKPRKMDKVLTFEYLFLFACEKIKENIILVCHTVVKWLQVSFG